MGIKLRKTVTPKQLQANRVNSQRSTGPKTLVGKRFASKNALSHGLLSSDIVIDNKDGGEDRGQFEVLLTGLREDYCPEGTLENLLVEKIACCAWRLRRAIRCETGETRKTLHSTRENQTYRQWLTLDEDLERQWRNELKMRMPLNSIAVQLLIAGLEEAESEVEETGRVSEKTLRMMNNMLGKNGNNPMDSCGSLFAGFPLDGTISRHEPFSRISNTSLARMKRRRALWEGWLAEIRAKLGQDAPVDQIVHIRMHIRLLIGFLERVLEQRKREENLRFEAHIQSLSLPEPVSMDRILRYETTIERQLYRALAQLERLQRQRLGDHVPAPVSVHLRG